MFVLGLLGVATSAGAAPTALPASPMTRAAFAQALAQVKPGTRAAQVRKVLGEPDDIRTERDPGGITAARTVAVWRYGTDGHLTFGTRGTVHIQADDTVQYVFGDRGTPPPESVLAEPELCRLLRLLDVVPSYNGPGDPLAIIQAVNALHRVGRERALAAVREYLRVSSPLDDAGREGTFLVLRALFAVPEPPGYQPSLWVGAPSPPTPADLKSVPRFPLALVEDVPLLLVHGYSLGGLPQRPEDHLEWFRAHGVLRARPLAPPDMPLTWLDRLAGSAKSPFLTATGLADDAGRRLLLAQGLKLVRTAFRASLAPGGSADDAWQKVKAALGTRSLAWDAATDRYRLADGSVLPSEQRPQYQRAIWKPALPGGVVQVILERSSPTDVKAELRVELRAGATLPSSMLRFHNAQGQELLALPIAALQAPFNSSTGLVQSGAFQLREGSIVSVQLTRTGQSELREQLTP